MPRGFSAGKQVSAEMDARQRQQRANQGPSALWFRLGAGDDTVVRFLEEGEDVVWAMVHEVPVDGRSWGRPEVCLDQDKQDEPCPGCEADLPRKFKFYINLIWHDAPVFKRDSDNRLQRDQANDPIILRTEPQVAVWSSGIRLFDELGELDTNYKGLSSCRFRVKRKGQKLDTKYTIVPEDVHEASQEFEAYEKKLLTTKYDLNTFVQPKSYEDFKAELHGSDVGNGRAPQPVPNVFMRS